MSYTGRLFRYRKIYDTGASSDLFAAAMRENALFQYKNCQDYKRILDERHFDPAGIRTAGDLDKLPFIPTLYFKHHDLFAVPEKKMLIKATSSGTGGKMSRVGFDLKTMRHGARMIINVGRYHKLWSLKPVNYVIFGYRPTKTNKTAVSKTAYGFTFFAPALSRTFALDLTKDGYELSWDRVLKALEKASRSPFPMRTIGFPAYTYFLLRDMKAKGIKYKMPKGSMLTLGGGWKQFYSEKIDKKDFYRLVEEVLGIKEDKIVEFFGAVEHPILYTDCRCHRFHVPVYSRVIIRDPDTMEALPYGRPGLINLMTPLMNTGPLLSIMTDDIGILHNEKCGCGAPSPWLEIIGRVGIKDVITCAQGSEEYLEDNT